MKAGHSEQDVHLIDFVINLLVLDEPVVRRDVVEAASARLAAGEGPTALDLADTVVAHFA
jgi:hypothetical protein